MHYLMGYKMPVVESKSGVEHSVVAADGKRYGIIKEGTKFYVKVSDAAKENIAESYEYINGVLAKKENEHKSYNSASKALELPEELPDPPLLRRPFPGGNRPRARNQRKYPEYTSSQGTEHPAGEAERMVFR